jgi:hypothetical protein
MDDDDTCDGSVGYCSAGYVHSDDSNAHAHDASEVAADGVSKDLQHPVADRMQMPSSTEDRLKRILFSFLRIFLVFIRPEYSYFLFSL